MSRWNGSPAPRGLVTPPVREGLLNADDILKQDVDALEAKNRLDQRQLQKDTAYRDRQYAFAVLYGEMAMTAGALAVGAFAYSGAWISQGVLVLWVGLVLIVGTMVCLMQYADIASRNPNNYRQLMQVNLPAIPPSKPKADASLIAAGDLSSVTQMSTCVGGDCCSTGTTWSHGKCIKT